MFLVNFQKVTVLASNPPIDSYFRIIINIKKVSKIELIFFTILLPMFPYIRKPSSVATFTRGFQIIGITIFQLVLFPLQACYLLNVRFDRKMIISYNLENEKRSLFKAPILSTYKIIDTFQLNSYLKM